MSRFLDEEIAHVARAEGLVVISNDHDFGALWHRSDADLFGVVMLRLKDQTVEGVVSALRQLFGQDAPSIDFGRTLIVVRDASFRVVPRS